MIGERDVVEIILEIVDVESSPASVAALHAFDPFAAARDRHVIFVASRLTALPIHRHHDHRGVIEIGVIGIVVLECPTARTRGRAFHSPVALEVEHLPRLQPVQALLGFRRRPFSTRFHQRVTGQRGVPHWRDAGLAIGLVFADHQKIVERSACGGARRIVRGFAQHFVHHHGVGHRRIDRTQAVIAVQSLFDERDRGIDCTRPQLFRKQRLDHAQHTVERAEQKKPAPALMRRLGRHPDRMRRLQEQLVDADAAHILGARFQRRQNHQRHDRGPRPV